MCDDSYSREEIMKCIEEGDKDAKELSIQLYEVDLEQHKKNEAARQQNLITSPQFPVNHNWSTPQLISAHNNQVVGGILNIPNESLVTESSRQSNYPYELFPPVVKDAILFLHKKYNLPPEISGNMILSAASIACQPLFEVAVNADDNPETCSLYLMTIVRSGGGKSLAFEKIMKPFLDKYSTSNVIYNKEVEKYTAKKDLWSATTKEINKEYRKLKRSDPKRKELEDERIQHQKEEPLPPKHLFNVYADITPAGLKDGLSDSIHAAILTDEGDVFLDGYAKNSVGIYNLLWDGAELPHKRSNSKHIAITAPLTISISVQNPIFEDYLEKNKRKAAGSGYLPRFLFVYNERNDEGISENSDVTDDGSMASLLEALSLLVNRQNEKYNYFYENDSFDDNDSNMNLKRELILFPHNQTSNDFLRQKINEFNQKTRPGGEWEHIHSSVLKAREQIIRLSGILHCLFLASKNEIANTKSSIDISSIESVSKIIEWYLDETARLLRENQKSKPTPEDDALRVLKNMLENYQRYNNTFTKTILQQNGSTERLRRKPALEPALEILRANNLINGEVITYHPNRKSTEIHRLSPTVLNLLRNNSIPFVLNWARQTIMNNDNCLRLGGPRENG